MAQTKLSIIEGQLIGGMAVFVPGNIIEIPFNPTEYSIDKSNSYSEATIPGLESPLVQFSHGANRTLSFELLLDTYAYEKGADVRSRYIERLEKLIEVNGIFHAPPPCKIVWGSTEFIGVLESMQKQYLMFKEDGIPVRARVNLSFKEYVPLLMQMAKSPRSSPDKHKIHLIKEGDSLWRLAYEEYGDPAYWRFIADKNQIDDPVNLVAGQKLILEPLH